MSLNLYTKTEYSFLESTIKIDDIVSISKEKKYDSFAITDNNLHGVFKFYNKLKNNNIKPIIGLEVKIESKFYEYSKILLYATNLEGYKNLIKISSYIYINKFKVISIELLKKYSKNLICVTAGIESDIDKLYIQKKQNIANQIIKEYNQMFDYVFVGLSNSRIKDELYKNFDTVIINKTLYLNKKDKKYYSYIKKIRNINFIEKEDFYLHDFKEVEFNNSKYINAIKNLEFIKKNCNVKLDYKGYVLPKYPTENYSSIEYLTNLCKKGLEKRLSKQKIDPKIYISRLKYELKVINEMGFSDYFLIVWDFVKYSKVNNILIGPGRGSAAGSLVSYCLGITGVDPIKFNLLFERFLNPQRITMPDIDLDFPDDRRDEVIKYVQNKYGKDRVCNIVTFSRFGARSSIRDISKIMKLPDDKLKKVLKHIPSNTHGIRDIIRKNKELKDMLKDKEIYELLEVSSNIEGLIRQSSTHAAGILITKDKITEYTGISNGNNEMYQSQFEMSDLEKIGLLKIDFLGLKNLSMLSQIKDLLYKDRQIDIDLYSISLNEEKAFELLSKGDTMGIFQLESEGMKKSLKIVSPNRFEDLVSMLALYRPGPIENIPIFAKRKNENIRIDYLHKDLIPILKDTYGIIIYQEQIMKIAYKFANYSLAEADLLRRAISKKDSSILKNERDKFIRKSRESGYDVAVANKIYNYILKFANYGFNRSHSVSYAMISYWFAFFKAYYSKYFFTILLNSVIGSTTQTSNYISEAKKYNITTLQPSINNSELYHNLNGDNIIFGLLGIKNIGLSTSSKLMEIRKNGTFINYKDYLLRIGNILNEKTLENLINSGAFDEFGLTKFNLINRIEVDSLAKEFVSILPEGEYILNKDEREFSDDELTTREKDALGFNLKYFPLKKYKKQIEELNLKYVSQISNKDKYSIVKLIGIINDIKVITTKSNKEMAFFKVNDSIETLDCVLFDKHYQKFKSILENGNVYMFEAKVEDKDEKLNLLINDIVKLNQI